MADRADLREARAVLLDMDGVVYIGEQPLPGVQELLDYLEATQRDWLFVTNNSSRTPAQFVEKIARMGIRADEAHILSSALATASWLSGEYPDGARVFMIGQDGLRWALEREGVTLVEDALRADVVVSGIDFSVRYERLADATLAVRAGARLVGTNSDTSFPSERGQIPRRRRAAGLVGGGHRRQANGHRQTQRRHVRTGDAQAGHNRGHDADGRGPLRDGHRRRYRVGNAHGCGVDRNHDRGGVPRGGAATGPDPARAA